MLDRKTIQGLATTCAALVLFASVAAGQDPATDTESAPSEEAATPEPAGEAEAGAGTDGESSVVEPAAGAGAFDPASVIADPIPLQDFHIGVSDTLNISVWKSKELNARVPVAPDGMISLPLVGDVLAAGRTPAEVRAELKERYGDFLTAPEVSLVVTAINSRVFYIIGEVSKQGVHELLLPTTILQGLARAGGLSDYAKKDNIVVLRRVNDVEQFITLSIKGVEKGRSLEQNILLMPGDTIIVP